MKIQYSFILLLLLSLRSVLRGSLCSPVVPAPLPLRYATWSLRGVVDNERRETRTFIPTFISFIFFISSCRSMRMKVLVSLHSFRPLSRASFFGSLSCFYCFHSQVLPMPTDIKSFGNCSSLSLVFVSLRLFLLFSHCGRYDQRRWNRSDQIVNGTCWTVEGRSLHSLEKETSESPFQSLSATSGSPSLPHASLQL